MSKVCTVCKEDKPLDQYHKQPAKKDGLQSLCKSCHIINAKKNKEAYKNGEKQFECYNILPINKDICEWQAGKYAGHVGRQQYTNGNLYLRAVIHMKSGETLLKNFTYELDNENHARKEAEEWLWKKSLENGMLKNRIRVIDENMIEVELSKGQIMKTDMKFAETCQKYFIGIADKDDHKKGFYATIFFENGRERFHRYITGFQMVDHINRDPLDNRLCNLREATFKINGTNTSMHSNNTSGYTGVRFDGKRWIACLECDGKKYSKAFNVNTYGEEEAKRLAIEHRIALCKQFGNNNQLSKDIPNFIEQ